MTVRVSRSLPLPRAMIAAALLVIGVGLNGCAEMSDTMSTAFADPAKYELYDCKQLETERKNLATRGADLQKLMAKAETGVAGSVVAEVAYRNEYISIRGQSKFVEDAWQRSKCDSMPASATPAVVAPANPGTAQPSAKSAQPSRSGRAVY